MGAQYSLVYMLFYELKTFPYDGKNPVTSRPWIILPRDFQGGVGGNVLIYVWTFYVIVEASSIFQLRSLLFAIHRRHRWDPDPRKRTSLGESLAESPAYTPIWDSRGDAWRARKVSPRVSLKVSPRVSERVSAVLAVNWLDFRVSMASLFR